MAEQSLPEFFTLLRKSRLLTPPQFDAAQTTAKRLRAASKATESPAVTAEHVAMELVREEVITQWQSAQLLKGQTGFILQQYRLLAPVGRGGMGHVFKAIDTNSGNIVAIKVMSRKLTGNQTLVNRFRREIRASSLLKSRHIVKTLDAGRVGKVDFMVMEYVNGDQVDRIVSRVAAIPVAMACDIVRQAAIGLQHAHEQKMVHRDLKPGNLIVDWSADGIGTVKIMDMGLVRLSTDGDERTSVTKAGQIMGTPDYMSPEQGWDTATVDIRSDIYSLGCTLFRLITGRVPFPGDNPLQVLMARCSKDAPSVKSLRSDVPDPVEAIVRRMTLRDPSGRYQSPQELAAALEPFCSPLTVSSIRAALREAGEDDAILLEMASVTDSNDPQDAGYQQFLREMDSGAAVDLMMSTNGGQSQALSTTLPVVSQTDHRPGSVRSRPKAKSSQTIGVIALASGSAMVALVVLFAMVNGGGDVAPSPIDPSTVAQSTLAQSKQNEAATNIPRAKFKPAQPVNLMTGTLLTFQPELDGERPTASGADKFRFQLGQGAPAAVKINQDSGEIRWDIAKEQASAAYDIPIELVYQANDKTTVVASMMLVANVNAGRPKYSFPAREPIVVLPDERVTLRVQATPEPDTKSGLQYRLTSGQLPGMTLDSETGEFSWTPSAEEVGRNIVAVELYDVTSSKALATGSIALFVRPSFKLPTFPEQSAKAGETFQLQLLDRPPRAFARVMQIVVKPGGPPGVVVDTRRATLSWDVPKDASGKYDIRLQLESQLPAMESGPDTQREILITVNVQAVEDASKVPPAKEVEAAEAELRELFKREIAGAKAVTEKAVLASQMLERAEDQQASAADYALLNLIAELAEKGRAADVGLRANQLRSIRYAVPELPLAVQAATSYKPSSIGPTQADSVIENLLRIALAAALDKRYEQTAVLLTPPEQMLKKADRGTVARILADDVSSARKLAEELSENATVAADLKADELIRLLQRWQFKELFVDTTGFSYVTSGDSNIADSGRSLWSFDKGHIRLTAEPQDASVGILDTTLEAERYLLRLQLAAKSSATMLIFGAGREQNLNSHLLSLDKSEFGRILTLPGGATVIPPTTGLTIPGAGWNDVEVLVDGPQVRIRLNGTPVMASQVPSLKPGRLGLLIPLKITSSPSVDLRRSRILILPDGVSN